MKLPFVSRKLFDNRSDQLCSALAQLGAERKARAEAEGVAERLSDTVARLSNTVEPLKAEVAALRLGASEAEKRYADVVTRHIAVLLNESEPDRCVFHIGLDISTQTPYLFGNDSEDAWAYFARNVAREFETRLRNSRFVHHRPHARPLSKDPAGSK